MPVWLLAFLTSVCLVASVTAAEPPARADGPVSFRNDVMPVLTKASCNSGPCHGAEAGKSGFKLSLRGHDPDTDYAALTRESLGRRVSRLAPAHSLMLLKPTATIPHGGGQRFAVNSTEYRVLADWIAQGAAGPSPQDPYIVDIAVAPASTLKEKAGEAFELTVTAHYSDGSSDDVTRWAKYETTNGGTATVDEMGGVKTTGPGEAAITVWYSSKVGFARVAVPFREPVDPSVLASLPRANYVDELVFGKLQQLNIQPSALSSDAVFMRRLYLSTMGVLPTLEELKTFLADERKEKRRLLIDRVLRRSEFVDYWSYKWSDLLLVSSETLRPAGVQSYYNWIRQSVADNKPWDQMVRELVTAQGSTLVNGAANYWAIHQDPKEITENLSMTFLGTSITCARCHNHPLEKWTQNQYYGLANLVTQVSIKQGDRPGESFVVNRYMGDINHPRLNRPMAPQPLDGTALDLDAALDRRAHLAEWLTSPENPYFSRALVNRVWTNLMGRGLVHPVDDLRATNPSSNPDLMQALTRDVVRTGFDVRHLIRTIVSSTAFQLSSETNPSNQNDDSFYSHHLTRRLPAEVILDIMSQVTGVPEEFDGYPVGTRALQLPDAKVESYFLDAFGRPPRDTPNSSERTDSANLAQVLHLINGGTLNRKLKQEGGLVEQMVGQTNRSDFLDHLYSTILGRSPSTAEEESVRSFLGASPAREQVEDVVWAMLTSREFLFTR